MRKLGCLIALCLSVNAGALERFAIIAGSNEGGGARATLWFAERDADRLSNTLKELGDFEDGHVRVLHGATRKALEGAFASLEEQIQRAHRSGQRTVLLFYFSGHAGSGALELGSERLEFTALKSRIESSQADVKVAIVDACESGQLTQVKGARVSADLDFALPNAEITSGVAYIASTAAGEVAQESAALGGSFFTFHLETALRGAGDANGDGQVSLAEAFAYTASRTTTGTSTTAVGPQHPTYNFRMSGRGDVVLSDLRKADATLTLAGDTSTLYVISKDQVLVAEAAGGLSLALPAGSYRIERRTGGQSWSGTLELGKGETRGLPELTPLTRVAVRGKGGDVGLGVYAGFALGMPVLANVEFLPGVRLGISRFFGQWSGQAAIGYSTAMGDLGSGVNYRLHDVDLDLTVLYRVVPSWLDLDAGLRLGTTWHHQTVSVGTAQDAWSGTGAAVVRASHRIGSFLVGLEVAGGGRTLAVNHQLALRPHAFATLFVGAQL